MTPLRTWLDKVLVAADISQNELARRCGWHISRLSRLANAKSVWTAEDVREMVEVAAPLLGTSDDVTLVELHAALAATPFKPDDPTEGVQS